MRDALTFALDNPYSDFYRRKYGSAHATLRTAPIEDIPFLVRDEIDATPVLERTFVPPELVRFIRSTSGSSGRGVIGFPMLEEGLLQAHLRAIGHVPHPGQNSRYFEPYFTQMGIRSALLFSAGAFVHEVRVREMEGRSLIAGEFSEPKLTASLAVAAEVDAIIGSPSGLVDFTPHLQRAGGAARVRLILCVGERSTSLQVSALARAFPNAKIASQYGLTESQGYVGYSCPQRLSIDPAGLHLAEGTMLMELIDPETLQRIPLEPLAEGELVVTTHEPQGFPLIRYRTGDLVRIRQERCGCPLSPRIFECLGRAALDRVHVPRGVLTVAAIDEGLASLKIAAQEFSASWKTDTAPPGLSILLSISGDAGNVPSAETIARAIRIASQVTYQDIVEAGLALPLSLAVAPPEPWVGWRKKKRLS